MAKKRMDIHYTYFVSTYNFGKVLLHYDFICKLLLNRKLAVYLFAAGGCSVALWLLQPHLLVKQTEIEGHHLGRLKSSLLSLNIYVQ